MPGALRARFRRSIQMGGPARHQIHRDHPHSHTNRVAEFEISKKIIITFTAYEKGHKAKDEETLGLSAKRL